MIPNTKTILKRLKDAGIDADPNLSREELITLAGTKGVSLDGAPASGGAPDGDASAASGDAPPGAGGGDAPPSGAAPAGSPPASATAPAPAPEKAASTKPVKKPAELPAPDPAPRFGEGQIREKIRAGLTRNQAIEVLTSQAEHDATLGIKPAPLAPGEASTAAEEAAASRFPEEQIREKTRAGLTRDQAIEVLTSQAEHDAYLASEGGAQG